ncbi:cytochrome c [Aliiroseovarius sp. F20344]|uniref:c-type cytochrome n=1 Tax=Aliiroseovarius sp. F20344 TaxID=2926414 RepID=UPI001FF1F833|nr:cytochrome c [Aliiroseovarius sp. F20344]MCK0141969.1 cytochrome c [Aliiroseovarius sp. F20344]
MAQKRLITYAAVTAVVIAGVWFLQLPTGEKPSEVAAQPKPGAAMVDVRLPAVLSGQSVMGKRAFDAVCASCHGENAAGQQGTAPPLVHKIYEPSHHADMAFVLAAQRGVKAHHWPFGDMPPVEGLTNADIATIVSYVRELQRENGIN